MINTQIKRYEYTRIFILFLSQLMFYSLVIYVYIFFHPFFLYIFAFFQPYVVVVYDVTIVGTGHG